MRLWKGYEKLMPEEKIAYWKWCYESTRELLADVATRAELGNQLREMSRLMDRLEAAERQVKEKETKNG